MTRGLMTSGLMTSSVMTSSLMTRGSIVSGSLNGCVGIGGVTSSGLMTLRQLTRDLAPLGLTQGSLVPLRNRLGALVLVSLMRTVCAGIGDGCGPIWRCGHQFA
jgi:hypothetical protein